MPALSFADVVHAWDQAALLIELNGTVSSWNPAAEQLFGYPAADIVGQPFVVLFSSDRRDDVAQMLSRITAGTGVERCHTVGAQRDGRPVPLSLAMAPLADAEGKVVGASIILRDITRLQNTEENFRRVVEASPSGILLVDGAGQILLVNRELERVFGYDRAELIGQPVEMLVPDMSRGAHVASREAFHGSDENRPMGHGRTVSGRRKDGSHVLAEVALSPLITLEGPVTLGVVVDVSEREVLLHRLEAQAAELHRSNDELLQFAYVASHDLQEPLRMVASFAELLDERSRAHLDEKGLKYLGYVTEGARRMQQLVRDLLTYSRLGTQARPLAPVDLSRLTARLTDDLRLLISTSGATVSVGALPTVLGDEAQLGQVLQNLMTNAIKFHGDAPPRVSISAERTGDLWAITVEDNGIGIDMKYHDRVFEMFQRLHGRGQFEGSGIGLAIVRRIVLRHGGSVWFESTLGVGTRFHFTLVSAS